MIQVNINLENCIGCKRCYNACFVDVIRWDETAKRPIAKYPEECAVCGWCAIKCPNECITVIPDYTMPQVSYYPKSFYPKSCFD